MCSWKRTAPLPKPSGGKSFRIVRMIAPFGILTARPCRGHADSSARPRPRETSPSPAPMPSMPSASRRFSRVERVRFISATSGNSTYKCWDALVGTEGAGWARREIHAEGSVDDRAHVVNPE